MYGSAPIVVLLLQRADKSADVCYSPGGLQPAAMSKRRCSVFHEDTLEKLLDRVSYMREELIAIERSLERMQIAKLARGKGARSQKSALPIFRIPRRKPATGELLG